MAPKRPSTIDNPPSVTPSSDEEESEEISDNQQTRNPNYADSEGKKSDSSSEEEEETATKSAESDDDVSGSDTESSDTATEFTVKPNVSKTIADSPKHKKITSKAAPKSPTKNAGVDLNETQKKGKPVGNGKSPIIRIWTEDGELAVLKGLYEYRMKKGLDPYSDKGAFYEYMKRLVPVEVTQNQVLDKIRRLKKKYVNNAKRGEDPFFSKPHGHKSFQLSKKIWGGTEDAVMESGVKSGKRKAKSVGVEYSSLGKEQNGEKSGKRAKNHNPLEFVKEGGKENEFEEGVLVEGLKGDQVGFWDKYSRLKEALEVENFGCLFKEGKRAWEVDMSKMGDEKAKALEDKWKRFQAKEAELKLFKLDLVREQTKVVLEELMKP